MKITRKGFDCILNPVEIKLTEAELEEAYTEFLNRKFIRDTRYFLEENYLGEPDEETIASIAKDYKESLGNRVEQLENEVFDDVMEMNYPEHERNWCRGGMSMSNLMDELMAEMNRVNNLETEVNKTVNQLSHESGLARQEKLKEICQFLLRMTDLLLQAKVIKPANSSSCQYYSAIVNTGIRFQRITPTNDAPCYSLKLAIYGNAVNVRYLQEASGVTLIWKGEP